MRILSVDYTHFCGSDEDLLTLAKCLMKCTLVSLEFADGHIYYKADKHMDLEIREVLSKKEEEEFEDDSAEA